MKVCEACGDSYRDHVEFCFNDGEVLVLAEALGSRRTVELDLDAPPLPSRAHLAEGGAPEATPATSANAGPWPAMSATPVPRANRRSLLRPTAPTYTPPAPTPVPANNVPEPVGELRPPSEVDALRETPALAPVAPRPPPSEVDTAPLPRPQREPPSTPPETPGLRRAAGPVRSVPPTPTPVPRAATLEVEALEEPNDTRGMLMAGVAAAVLGLCFVLGSGLVIFYMGWSGLLPRDPVGAMASHPPSPVIQVPRPLPPPVAPAVEPDGPVEPAPIEPAAVQPDVVPEPVPSAEPAPTEAPPPAPVAPAPEPAPEPPRPPRPAPRGDGVAVVEPPAPSPAPVPPPPAPVAPAKVPVKFQSDPAGAEVWVDGTLVVEATPGAAELQPGPRRYEMRLDGHVPQAGTFEPAAGAEVKATLQPQVAVELRQVMVYGLVGARLSIDGQLQPNALPCKVMLTPGAHTFKVTDSAGVEAEYVREVDPSKGFVILP